MMTQTHMLIGAALFAKPGHYARNTVAVLGGIIPDIAIFVMYGWEKLKGTPSHVIWDDIYFNSLFWKNAVAWGNSAPLYLLILLAGLAIRRFSSLAGIVIMVFAASCLAHLAGDFLLHVNDAHRHLFPLSDYRFVSAVSYWDPNHYGNYWSVVEIIMSLGIAVLLYRRFHSLFARLALGLLVLAYIAVPAYFFWTLGIPG